MASRRSAICLIAMGISALASIGGASALDYPTRPVRFVVGYPPGGATDILARLIGQRLSEKLGQQFVIENKPGAGLSIRTRLSTAPLQRFPTRPGALSWRGWSSATAFR